MQKTNLLWEKAQKRLSGAKLADLYVDLKVQDKYEFALKKLRVDGMDKEGQQEAQVNAAFKEIVEKYGLEDFYAIDENNLPEDDKKQVHFKDKKLQSMWKRAEEAGFTERDLEKLREEFWHQQMKIDEMNFLKQELGVEDVTDNEVQGAKKPGKTPEEKKALEYDLRSQGKDIKAGYYKLENVMSEFDREEPEFRDHRVYKLWAMARKTDWSPEELESFKEELLHFEQRLQKHEHYEEQLMQSAQALKDQVDDGKYPEKHMQLEERTQDLARKVKKLHDELKMRVSKAFAATRHTEL